MKQADRETAAVLRVKTFLVEGVEGTRERHAGGELTEGGTEQRVARQREGKGMCDEPCVAGSVADILHKEDSTFLPGVMGVEGSEGRRGKQEADEGC